MYCGVFTYINHYSHLNIEFWTINSIFVYIVMFMLLNFSKYHGTGNDFIMVYNHNDSYCLSQSDVKKMCNRRYGVGADGLIIVEKTFDADFKMIYYNADGFVGSMCGNGARCAVSFARELELIQSQCEFLAYDGMHKGIILENGLVSIEMVDVSLIEVQNNMWKIDTGSPHLICFRETVSEIDVFLKSSNTPP